jgi:hypothetical protein
MQAIIPPDYLPFIRATIAGITLSGDVLYLQQGAEGMHLAKDDLFSSMTFAFPDGWKPPLHTPLRVKWLRAFFNGVTLDGHELRVEEDEGFLLLKEVLNERGEAYPWIVEFVEGWAPPPSPEWDGSRQRCLPSAFERAWLVEQLGRLYGMTPASLVDLSHEQLVPLIDLAPDIAGISIRQRWMEREPKHWW